MCALLSKPLTFRFSLPSKSTNQEKNMTSSYISREEIEMHEAELKQIAAKD